MKKPKLIIPRGKVIIYFPKPKKIDWDTVWDNIQLKMYGSPGEWISPNLMKHIEQEVERQLEGV